MHVVYSFPHEIGRSGIGTTALHQVQGVARARASVTLFCTSVHVALDPRIRVVRTLSTAGVRLPHRALGIHRAYRVHDRMVAMWLTRNHGSVDLVHVWPAGCLQTLQRAAQLGVPTAREVPNTHTGHAFETVAREMATLGMSLPRGHSHAANPEALAREEREYLLADTLLVPSEYSQATFVERGFANDRLRLHQYGYDPASFPAPSGLERRERDGGLRAVFLGRCEPRKGLHHALQAWLASGAANRGKLTVCGTFVPGYAEALGRALSHPSVELRAFDPDPGALLRRSDLLLLPSVEEGSALVTYEAQASGCALAVSDAAGARATHGVEALIHPAGDVETLTDQLRQLDEAPQVVARLRRGAVANSRALTWDKAAETLVTAYQGAITFRRGAGAARRHAR